MKAHPLQTLSLVALAAAPLQGGCLGACDGQEYTYWSATNVQAGTIEAPADLELPATIDPSSGCGSMEIETCQRQGSCSPSFCLSTSSQSLPTYLLINVGVRGLSG